MNERIKQIEKETWQNVAELGQVRWSDWRDEFAKLIVRECADIVTDAVDHREPASTYADKIRQHFGVEE